MESKTLKYMDTGNNDTNGANTRSKRNSRLYREVYGKYGELDNLPIQDNTDEIDMDRLREIVNHKESTHREDLRRETTVVNDSFGCDNQKVYDINQLLEKAKYENNKLKDPPKKTTEINRNILQTLESRELSLEEIKKACQKYDENIIHSDNMTSDDSLSATREMKYHKRQISNDPLIEQVMPDSNLSLDLFEDLKPTGNTIITKPIIEEEALFREEQDSKNIEEFFHSEDTSDIDVIKNTVKNNNIDNDFYTSSYRFSKKDFNDDDDDFFDEKPSSNIFKIILLIVAIIVFIFVIYYFVTNYGFGA